MPKTRPARRSEDAPHVERAYRNLKAAIVGGRYRPGASLSEVGLATEHGMSRSHFSHDFKARTGLSPGRFMAEVRIQEASRLLLQPSTAWKPYLSCNIFVEEIRIILSRVGYWDRK